MSDTAPSTAIIRIERLVAGGFGLGRHEGKVLLVPLTAPGDEVEVKLPERGAKSRLARIVTPGPDRVEPPCRHFGVCGGCDLMQLSYPAQLRVKLEMVAETIERIGGRNLLSTVGEVGIEANPVPLHSRIRATWQPTETGTAGYFRRGSHEVIEIDDCPILDQALEGVRSELRISDKVHGLTNGTDVSLAAAQGSAELIEFDVADARILASADAFFQASSGLLDKFVRHVVHLAGRGRPTYAVELYSGVGLFTVSLASHVGQVDAIESSMSAVELARKNVQRNCLRNVACHVESTERWVARQFGNNPRPEIIVVDPPRIGLSDVVLSGMLRIEPHRIVYVSCDPATFARDARRIVDAGYHMTNLTVFDLFPQTHHTETVAAFDRSSSGSGDPA